MESLKDIVNYCNQNGFVFQGSEIYGGLANSWDYGPLGRELKENIKKMWWDEFVRSKKNSYGLDSAIIMNPNVWVASGHVTSFADPLIDCKKCKARHRADKLIEDATNGEVTADGWDNEKIEKYISDNKIKCPTCGASDFTPIRKFNLLFETYVGVTDDTKSKAYLRGETAQGIFVNFKNVERTMRAKIPFGVGQIGKAFRNEITPGNFIFRVREFEQMEYEFFCKPDTDLEWFNYWKDNCIDFLKKIGLKEENLRYRDHSKEELSFYSKATTDIEFLFPMGWGELWGIADRTNYDLSTHIEHSKEDLSYFDQDTNEKYIPYVIEPSVGVDRLFLAILCDAYDAHSKTGDVERELLKINYKLAPYKVAVLPLIKKKHADLANEVFSDISKYYSATYDESGNIGKRYRRNDAIGTPFCVTIDDESIDNNTVTVRNRDTMEQVTINITELKDYLDKEINK